MSLYETDCEALIMCEGCGNEATAAGWCAECSLPFCGCCIARIGDHTLCSCCASTRCRECGGNLVERAAVSVEPHGERCAQEWLECRECGEKL